MVDQNVKETQGILEAAMNKIVQEVKGQILFGRTTLHYKFLFLDEYYVHVEPKTHAEAIRVCKGLGRQLFEPRNFSTKSKVIALAKTKGVTRFWIGIHDTTNEGNFTYDSDGQKIGYKNWFPNEPNNIGSGEDCVEIMGGNWNDLPCNRKRSFVCENTQLGTCNE